MTTPTANPPVPPFDKGGAGGILTKGRGDFASARDATGKGVLLPYQRRWVGDPAAVKVIEKSRRIGISWAEAGDAALYAAASSGGNVLYIGYNKEMAQEFIGDCASWARGYAMVASAMDEEIFEPGDDEGRKAVLAYRITFASGFSIRALSSRPRSLRAKQGRIIIDEAAFHDDLDGLIKAAMAHRIWGGTIRIISTHNGEANPFNELINDIRAGKKRYALHRETFDEALAEGLYRRICQVLKREWSPQAEALWREEIRSDYGEHAAEELDVIPSQGSGVFLSRLLIEQCMDPSIPVLRWECPEDFARRPDAERAAACAAWCEDHLGPILAALNPHYCSYVGGDFGRTGDLSVFVPLIEQPKLLYRAPFHVELRNVPFKQQEQILFFICDRLPRFRGGALDARGNGQYLAEVAMQRYGDHAVGGRIQMVMITIEWYREAMPKYKAAFEDRAILLAQDADTLDDHRAFKMEKGVARLPETLAQKGRDGKQRHGDAGIAGAMAWFAVKAGGISPADAGREPTPEEMHPERHSLLDRMMPDRRRAEVAHG